MSESDTLDPALKALADAYGIATDYWDWQGRHVQVPAATVRAVLTALDVDASTQSPTFVAPDGTGTRTVAIRVTDNFGQVVTRSQPIVINNVAPTATLAATASGATATATFSGVVTGGGGLPWWPIRVAARS